MKLQFKQVVKRLSGSDLKINITDAAIEWLADAGYDPHYGARPVKRILQKYVLNELSRRILSGAVEKDSPVTIDVDNGSLIFTN